METFSADARTAELLDGWQCTGCGKIDVDRPCVGICQDARVQLVYASDYAALAEKFDRCSARLAKLESIVRRVARAQPKPGNWEQSYKQLQDEARELLKGGTRQ